MKRNFNISNYQFHRSHIEGWFWIVAILLLAMTNPYGEAHFSLCAFKNMGLSFCPGCGIGHSISLLFRFRIAESFQAHPLGILAVFFLLRRSYQILFKSNINPNKLNYEQSIDPPTRD